jgi:phosphoribosylanthranilate isomerase
MIMQAARDETIPFIKICGIQTFGEAILALDCGATALGFLVGLTHVAADGVDEHIAREIIARLPAGANTVMVTHLLDAPEVARLARFMGARTVQVHNDMPVADLARLRSLLPGTVILKAVHVVGPEAISRAASYASEADGMLLDSRTADRLGGTGQTHDWSISRRIVASVSPRPVYLAGGLNPANVAQSILQVRPAGVDVNSGVEDADGNKDRSKVQDFVDASKAALQLAL